MLCTQSWEKKLFDGPEPGQGGDALAPRLCKDASQRILKAGKAKEGRVEWPVLGVEARHACHPRVEEPRALEAEEIPPNGRDTIQTLWKLLNQEPNAD